MTQSHPWGRLVGEPARRTPGTDELTHRLARLCGLMPGHKVLDLGAAAGAVARLLARDYGALVTCVDPDKAALDSAVAGAKDDGADGRLTPVVSDDVAKLQAAEAGFHVVVLEVTPALFGGIGEAAAALRKYLLPGEGKLVMTCRGRVGRVLPSAVESFYADQKYALLYPRQVLQTVEQAGFEPQTIEALPESVVDDFYAGLEAQLGAAPEEQQAMLRREIELYRRDGAREAIGFLASVARRKEPGEKPPASRGGE